MNGRGRSVGIVGGGLAGLAAAVALVERGFHVELFEAKRNLGGRAGSFVDPVTGELVDHCQHVAMGCCTAFLDFIHRTGVERHFRRDEVLHFFSPEGKQFDLRASRWLPPPLHLVPAMARIGYLSWREKFGIANALRNLICYRQHETAQQLSIGQWLRERQQSPRAIERFWQVVLVSALGEQLDRASVAAARKVFVDGFMATRDGYHIYVPVAPLGAIYEQGVARWLCERGARVFTEHSVGVLRRGSGGRVDGVVLPDGTPREFDSVIIATSWKSLKPLLPPELFPEFAAIITSAATIASSPITSLHLLFDREITPLPHAVLVDRLTQWVFSRGVGLPTCSIATARLPTALTKRESSGRSGDLPHGYQVVISASRSLAGRDREDVLREVLDDLTAVFPASRGAQLIHSRMLTQRDAVFSYRPGLDVIRPPQRTPIENLFLAGDYTATDWPSTMESAVRSGRLAADEVVRLWR